MHRAAPACPPTYRGAGCVYKRDLDTYVDALGWSMDNAWTRVKDAWRLMAWLRALRATTPAGSRHDYCKYANGTHPAGATAVEDRIPAGLQWQPRPLRGGYK